jgi:hypothetical protein
MLDMQMTTFKAELAEAVHDLAEHFDTLKSAARRRLGTLYNPADYPESLRGLFDVTWDYPSVEAHLTERLSGDEDGKPKVFRDSAVANLTEFFERFRHLNVGSSEQLDQLVSQAQQVVRGVLPQQLRDDQTLRQRVATQLSGVQSVLDGLLVDRPRRNILRRPR